MKSHATQYYSCIHNVVHLTLTKIRNRRGLKNKSILNEKQRELLFNILKGASSTLPRR